MASIPRAGTISNLTVKLERSAIGDTQTFFAGAQTSVVGDMFAIQSRPVIVELEAASKRGVAMQFLSDPEKDVVVRQNIGAIARIEPYGEMPYKNHSKMYVRDSTDAHFTTGTLSDYTAMRYEFIAAFDGDAAAAVDRVVRSTIDGDRAAQRVAVADAARLGIVYNDPMVGARYLTNAVYSMLDRARDRIIISTKLMNDSRTSQLLDEAERRGVTLAFTDVRSHGMHGNLLIADDDVYFGTAHLSPRSLGDQRAAYRRAREVGIVQTDGVLARRLLERLDEIGMDRLSRSEVAVGLDADGAYLRKQRLDEAHAAIRASGGVVTEEHAARLERAQVDLTDAQRAWTDHKAVVAAQRVEDGLTFGAMPDPRPRSRVDRSVVRAGATLDAARATAREHPRLAAAGAVGMPGAVIGGAYLASRD